MEKKSSEGDYTAEFYERVLEDLPDLICRWKPDGTITYVNENYCRYFGKDKEELIGESFMPFVPEEERQKITELSSKACGEAPVDRIEHMVIDSEGETMWQQWTNRALFDEDGRVVEFQSIGHDITDRKGDEEKLVESERKYRLISAYALDAIIMMDSSGVITYWNDAATKVFGFTENEVIGRDLITTIAPERYHMAHNEGLRNFISTGKGPLIGRTLEIYGTKKDGTEFPIELAVSAVTIGDKWYATGIIRDITERKKTESTLRESEERYRSLFDNVSMAVCIYDAESLCFEDVNEEAVRLFGYTREEFLKLTPMDISAEAEKTMETINRLMVEGLRSTHVPERKLKRKNGEVFLAEIYTGHFEEGGRRKMIGAVRDITERRWAENHVKESEAKYRNLFNLASDSIFIIDPETRRFLDVNEKAASGLGYTTEELLQMRIDDIDAPDAAVRNKEILKQLFNEKSIVFEHSHKRKDGTTVPVEINARMTEYGGAEVIQGMVRDLTARKGDELKIKKEKEKLQEYLDIAGVMFVVIGADQRVVMINRKGSEVLGWETDEMVGKNWFDNFLPEAHRGEVKVVFDALMNGKSDLVEFYENPVLTRDGTERLVAWHNRLLRDDEGCVYATLSSGEDITKRKKAEDELRKSKDEVDILNKELHHILTESSKIEDRERKRYSEILHEVIGQNLVAMKMGLVGPTEKCCPEGTEGGKAIASALAILDETIKATRTVTAELYPSVLDDMGLESAVEWYAHSVLEPHGIKVTRDVDGMVEDLPDEAKRILYRITRESLQNSLKYSGAKCVEISCLPFDGALRLSVKDNGKGFDYEETVRRAKRGIGLLLMREWAVSLDGNLIIESSPGKGTEICLEIPLSGKVS